MIVYHYGAKMISQLLDSFGAVNDASVRAGEPIKIPLRQTERH